MNKTKKKITVLTLQNVRNYGSVLQAFATQKVFESLGCEINFFDYTRKDNATSLARLKTWTEGKSILKKIIYTILLYPTFKQQDKIFTNFIRRHLHIHPGIYSSENDFRNIKFTSDIYCTGSDQTWNSGWNKGLLPEMFLSFVPDSKKKIAYAASFGKSQLDEWEKEETKNYLKRYAAISVRESTGVDICRELNIKNCVHVLDPTLQMNQDFWMQYVGKRKFKESYVLIYQLNSNSQFDKYAQQYAKQRGLKLLRFCTRFDQCIRPGIPLFIPNVLDFINYITYADTVITDSFHATAFCINMNTDFISVYPHNYNSRLSSILEMTHLTHRHLTSYDDFSFTEKTNINFTKANQILEKERKIGLEFLKKAIE